MAKSILVVDDSASVRKLVRLTLESAGYAVVEAGDGKDALDKLAGQKVHLVISDVNMPNMDGIALVAEMKKSSSHKFIPVIMLTTEDGAEKMRQGQEAGAKAWMVKPFRPQQILAAVGKLLL
jgi:two-component system chemotaxis response regulator CheY